MNKGTPADPLEPDEEFWAEAARFLATKPAEQPARSYTPSELRHKLDAFMADWVAKERAGHPTESTVQPPAPEPDQFQVRLKPPRAGHYWINCPSRAEYEMAIGSGQYEGRMLYLAPQDQPKETGP